MKSEFRSVFADGEGHAALEWTTTGTANGRTVEYGGVSILEIEDGKVKLFIAYFDPREITEQIVHLPPGCPPTHPPTAGTIPLIKNPTPGARGLPPPASPP